MKGSFPLARFATIETPFYYYDTALLRHTISTIDSERQQYEGYTIHYAVKANANPALLQIIAAAGWGADCVSGGEIVAARKAGIAASKIVFAGVGKTDKEIALALDEGIGCFNVESREEMTVINNIAKAKGTIANIALRINPNIAAHTHHHIATGREEDKFGIAMDAIDGVVRASRSLPHLRIIGLHCHIGSQITDMNDFAALSARLNALQDLMERQHGIPLQTIDVGGGLGIDYEHPNRCPLADFHGYFATFAAHLHQRQGQRVLFELGRAVVAPCGSLLTRVLYVKPATTTTFCIVDGGFTALLRPAFYGAYHKIENLTSDGPLEEYDVVGPLCESSDTFAVRRALNKVRRGDLLALRSAGAYGETMASGYNCRPLPKSYITEEIIPGLCE